MRLILLPSGTPFSVSTLFQLFSCLLSYLNRYFEIEPVIRKDTLIVLPKVIGKHDDVSVWNCIDRLAFVFAERHDRWVSGRL